MAPGIDDEGVAVSVTHFLSFGMGAGLCRGAEIGLGFDRARSAENFPMVLAGLQGDGSGQGDHLCSFGAQRLEESWEPQIVTDRAANRHVLAVIGHNGLARRESGALMIFRSIRRGDVKHMDLTVTRDFCAV